MIFDEWKKLVKGLKSVYTSEKFLPNGDSVKIWYELLKDMDYKVLNLAIQKYMLTGKFPPTIAELRECAVGITDPTTTNDYGDGWEQVQKAISKYGYYNADEALASMDKVTQQCVKRLGWKNICLSENPVADRANFRQIYEQEKLKRKELEQLPDKVKHAIEQIQGEEVKRIEAC